MSNILFVSSIENLADGLTKEKMQKYPFNLLKVKSIRLIANNEYYGDRKRFKAMACSVPYDSASITNFEVYDLSHFDTGKF